MPQSDPFVRGGRQTKPLRQSVVPNPFRQSPATGMPTGYVVTSAFASSLASPQTTQGDGVTAPAVGPSVPSAAAEVGAPTYTGAAMLGSYTTRRKILQKASALSTQMHHQVTAVVQLEEEQRLLSQAYRSRQKLAEQQEQQQQQQQPHKSQQQQPQQKAAPSGEGGGGAQSDDAATSTFLADGGDGPDAEGAATEVAASSADPYGVTLEGTADVKRLLQQQAHDKHETLGKMRGMQRAVQELTSEVTAEEERWLAHSRLREASSTETGAIVNAARRGDDGADATEEGDEDADSTSERGARDVREDDGDQSLPHGASPDVMSKMETIRDLRAALQDMLDVRHPNAASIGNYGSVGSGPAGSTWVEMDALYDPPPPPQVFSTHALAVTLECLTDSMASIARIADEFCIATTFRARNDSLSLLPHLQSLKKWTAQAERSVETAQRHLRHFSVGEAAVVEGGAYEVNSLREQTLLLKESLTAQDQKVKSTEEARAAVQHRLGEVRRRCLLWEALLLHKPRQTDNNNNIIGSSSTSSGGGGGISKENGTSAAATAVGESATFHGLDTLPMDTSAASLQTVASGGDSPPKLASAHGLDDSDAVTNVTDGGVAAPLGGQDSGSMTNTVGPEPSATFLVEAARNAPGQRTPLQAHPSSLLTADASPPPRPPPAATAAAQHPQEPSSLIDFLPLAKARPQASRRWMGGPPSASTMSRMERRVAQSWGNPYVRKQQLRERAEHAALQEQRHPPQQQQQQQPESAAQAERKHDGSVQRLMLSNSYLSGHVPGDGSLPAGNLAGAAEKLRDAGAGPAVPHGPEDVDLAALADARALQLLQSLLRSIPSYPPPSRTSNSTHDGSGGGSDHRNRDAGRAAGQAGTAAINVEAPLGVANLMYDDVAREATRTSVQRLMAFLRSQTNVPQANNPSLPLQVR